MQKKILVCGEMVQKGLWTENRTGGWANIVDVTTKVTWKNLLLMSKSTWNNLIVKHGTQLFEATVHKVCQ